MDLLNPISNLNAYRAPIISVVLSIIRQYDFT
jgi:hypothetical protein